MDNPTAIAKKAYQHLFNDEIWFNDMPGLLSKDSPLTYSSIIIKAQRDTDLSLNELLGITDRTAENIHTQMNARINRIATHKIKIALANLEDESLWSILDRNGYNNPQTHSHFIDGLVMHVDLAELSTDEQKFSTSQKLLEEVSNRTKRIHLKLAREAYGFLMASDAGEKIRSVRELELLGRAIGYHINLAGGGTNLSCLSDSGETAERVKISVESRMEELRKTLPGTTWQGRSRDVGLPSGSSTKR